MNNQDFISSLGDLLRANFPIIYVETHEEQRAQEVIKRTAKDLNAVKTPRKVFLWTITDGLLSESETSNPNTKNPLEALNAAISIDEPSVFIFKDLHLHIGDNNRPGDPAVIRRIRDVAIEFRSGKNPRSLVMLSPILRVTPEFEKETTILDFPLPSQNEIRALLETIINDNEGAGRIRIDVDNQGKEKLAQAALGLTLTEAENAFARAIVNDNALTDSDVELVQEEKRQIIRKSQILDTVMSNETLDDIGGLGSLKAWLIKRNNAWLADAVSYGLPAPRGVLITGVPGCGKSMTAKAMAAAWHLPILRMDVGRIFSGLVGSSEENMRKALKTAEAISPCILWIDEIEKGFASTGGQGDSGTSARVFGTFLTWLQEKSSPVFVIATANSIDRLPPELLRKGRFDEIFFVDLPTFDERKAIWKLHINKRLKGDAHTESVQPIEEVLANLSKASDGYSGAEIEQAVVTAMFDAFAFKRPVTEGDLLKAVFDTVPLSVTQIEEIMQLRSWADIRAVAASISVDDQKTDAIGQTESIEKKHRPGGRRIDI